MVERESDHKGDKMSKKQETYIRNCDTEKEAISLCTIKNKACRSAGNYRDIYAVVDGPESNFSVVDLSTAIDLKCGYRIA